MQDRVFLGGPYVDGDYAARREDAFIVAVNCFEPGGTCFCVSMGTGPKVDAGLRPGADGDPRRRPPLPSGGRHRPRRRAPRRDPAPRRPRAWTCAPPKTRSPAPPSRWAGRSTPTDLADLLAPNLEHPRWDDVADRCLTCGNCTMVCPTCFCTTWRTRPTSPASRPSACASGTPASRSTTRTSTAARPAVGPVALPPVADAQVRHLDRPVRRVRLHRLRPLHHLVPRWHRRDGGTGRDPGYGRRSMKTIEDTLRDARLFYGLEPEALQLIAGCGGNATVPANDDLFREGQPADTFYVIRQGRARSTRLSPQSRGRHDRDARPRRRRRTGRGSSRPTAGISTRARSTTCA